MNDATNPLVSIIIPTRNRVQYLERALNSIFEARKIYPNLEVIVIDGASTDGTVELLRRRTTDIAYWISERDSGCPEAANKGLAKAKGDILNFLGDDDELLPETVPYVTRYFREHPEVDALFGDAEYLKEDSSGNTTEMPDVESRPPGPVTLRDFLRPNEGGYLSPEQQFTRRTAFERYGGFDISFPAWSGYEHWCRLAKKGAVFYQCDKAFVRKRFIESCGTLTMSQKNLHKEVLRLLWRHGGPSAVLWLYGSRLKWKALPMWYKALRLTQPLRHPIRFVRRT